jgi:hypothetical protein
MLSEEIFPFDAYVSHPISSVLDEQDQKAFSNFLDTFFMDQLPTVFDTSSTTSSGASFMPPLTPIDDDVEEQRRNSILQSLDHQKQKLHERLNTLASKKPTSAMNDRPPPATPSSRKRSSSVMSFDTIITSSSSSLSATPKKPKHDHHHKELLTEEEKRANHIASEQKRRSTIRTGFKDLTDIIPTLKNINNSKSTVLFKAVDFIKYLDRRNKSRREKLHQLELRVQAQGKMRSSSRSLPLPSLSTQTSPASSSTCSPPPPPSTTTSSLYSSSSQKHAHFPPNVSAALLAHKSQQEQLLHLQEQLQLHQRLLARQQHIKENVTLAPLQHPSKKKAGFRAVGRHASSDDDDPPFLKHPLST